MLDALRAVWDRRKSWLCPLVALALLSCASLERGDASGIKSIDLPIVGDLIAWMDNEESSCAWTPEDESMCLEGGSTQHLI